MHHAEPTQHFRTRLANGAGEQVYCVGSNIWWVERRKERKPPFQMFDHHTGGFRFALPTLLATCWMRREVYFLTMTEDRKNTWLADVVLAFRAMDNGRAWLTDIYEWIRLNRKDRPKSFDSVIRATIYAHSTDAAAYVPGNPDVFRNVARGLWELRFPDVEDIPQRSTNLQVFVLTQMTTEELQSFSGKGDEFRAEFDRRVEEVRKKFNMPDRG